MFHRLNYLLAHLSAVYWSRQRYLNVAPVCIMVVLSLAVKCRVDCDNLNIWHLAPFPYFSLCVSLSSVINIFTVQITSHWALSKSTLNSVKSVSNVWLCFKDLNSSSSVWPGWPYTYSSFHWKVRPDCCTFARRKHDVWKNEQMGHLLARYMRWQFAHLLLGSFLMIYKHPIAGLRRCKGQIHSQVICFSSSGVWSVPGAHSPWGKPADRNECGLQQQYHSVPVETSPHYVWKWDIMYVYAENPYPAAYLWEFMHTQSHMV